MSDYGCTSCGKPLGAFSLLYNHFGVLKGIPTIDFSVIRTPSPPIEGQKLYCIPALPGCMAQRRFAT